MGQHLLPVRQHQHVNRGRPLFQNRRRHQTAADYGLVSTHGPFSVTAIQCSKCAEFEPSFDTAVHLSFNTTASGRPAFTMGSTASTMPSLSRGFSFLRST